MPAAHRECAWSRGCGASASSTSVLAWRGCGAARRRWRAVGPSPQGLGMPCYTCGSVGPGPTFRTLRRPSLWPWKVPGGSFLAWESGLQEEACYRLPQGQESQVSWLPGGACSGL